MAKQRVTVCLAPTEPADLQRAIGAAMAPYDYNRAYLDALPADAMVVRVLYHS
ncbi:hypothetical protein ACFYXH_11235 [Streptomyces sp. NPDC002730]|uniref:hypothetical protein n=1 Tax=Streptomyces sp. NPDC002730 TaxID=3364662 RepID=UPI0036B039C9